MAICPEGTLSYAIQPGDSLWLISQRFRTSMQAIAAANPMLQGSNLYVGQVLCIPKGYTPNTIFPQGNVGERVLSNYLRLLWEQHVYWTRMVILGIVFGLPDLKYTTDRLLRNPKDFETVLRPFYGEERAAKFAELFTSHLTIAAELVEAAKAGNTAAAGDAEKRWYANADQIAAFLGSLNPYWSAEEWQKMLYDHLALTKQEAVELLEQKYPESIQTFDEIEQEALAMADAMTLGLLSQFPSYFR